MLRNLSIAIACAALTACASDADSASSENDASAARSLMQAEGLERADLDRDGPQNSLDELDADCGGYIDLSYPADRSPGEIEIALMGDDSRSAPLAYLDISLHERQALVTGADLVQRIESANERVTVSLFAPICPEHVELQVQAYDDDGEPMGAPSNLELGPNPSGDVEAALDLFREQLDCEQAFCDGPDFF